MSFDVPQGRRLGIVGESGSGKTTAALALIQMLRPPGRVDGGSAMVDGIDLLSLGPEEIREHRLRTASYIPQGAMNSLNPVLTVSRQMRNALNDHNVHLTHSELSELIDTALVSVDLDTEVDGLYPHELSGGMKQRVCIAMSTLLKPKLIIADEPTSALDVVTQRQVMETLGRQQEETGSALILIGHDMGLMAQFVDQLAVMYSGRLVEIGTADEVFKNPLHPYTRALIQSVPRLRHRGELKGIPGMTPSLLNLPDGCAFHQRCTEAIERCQSERPANIDLTDEHCASCLLLQSESSS
jgi:peptide/nickel transport system ATP-binding protein